MYLQGTRCVHIGYTDDRSCASTVYPALPVHWLYDAVVSPQLAHHSRCFIHIQRLHHVTLWFLTSVPTTCPQWYKDRHLWNIGLSNDWFFKSRISCVLTHIVKFGDSVPWAVQKWLNQLKCIWGCWVMWVQGMYCMGCRCPDVKGHFWGVSPIEKHCKA